MVKPLGAWNQPGNRTWDTKTSEPCSYKWNKTNDLSRLLCFIDVVVVMLLIKWRGNYLRGTNGVDAPTFDFVLYCICPVFKTAYLKWRSSQLGTVKRRKMTLGVIGLALCLLRSCICAHIQSCFLHGNKDASIKIDFDPLTEDWLETQSCVAFLFLMRSQESKHCFCFQKIICIIKWQKSISVLEIRHSHTPSLF